MVYILNIETSGITCSVSLIRDSQIISLIQNNKAKSHAALLTPFIDEALHTGGIRPEELNAIAVSKGPGSYTGLRIGVSTAKGLAYGLQIPLIGINTLQSVTHGFLERYPEFKSKEDILFCPMIDARRMEVYSCLYSTKSGLYREISANIINKDSYASILSEKKIVFFGDGAIKCRSVIKDKNAIFIDFTELSASFMTKLSIDAFNAGDFEDTAYFEPFYLKDFVAGKPGVKGLMPGKKDDKRIKRIINRE